jgi:DNA-binding transcriptional LysR family regulator
MLPKLDRLISGSTFDPVTEHCSFRIAATDNATSIIAPVLCRDVLPVARQVRFTFASWRSDVFEDLSHGRLDLALIGDEGHVPSPLLSEVIYEEELVCLVAADAPYHRQLTLKQYLAAEHICVDVVEGSQHIPEIRLAALGHRRRTVITLPYFGAATRCVPGTKLILTAPRRFAELEAENRKVKVQKVPEEITGVDVAVNDYTSSKRRPKHVRANPECLVHHPKRQHQHSRADADFKAEQENNSDFADDVDLAAFDVLVNATPDELAAVMADSGKHAQIQLGIEDQENLVNQVNADALTYAKARAAEMVGKKWVDGELIDNPNAEWVITDTTRDEIRYLVSQVISGDLKSTDLPKALEDATAFSRERAN